MAIAEICQQTFIGMPTYPLQDDAFVCWTNDCWHSACILTLHRCENPPGRHCALAGIDCGIYCIFVFSVSPSTRIYTLCDSKISDLSTRGTGCSLGCSRGDGW